MWGEFNLNYDIFAEREKAGWSDPEIVDGYVSGFGPVVDAACDAHLDIMPDGGKVLDLCCGQGTLTARLAQRDLEVVGLDFSPSMLELARTAAPGIQFDEGDAQALPYDDGSFEAVVCNFGMMHIPDQPKALAEIARVLKPEGVFSMTSWIGPEASDAFRLVFSNARANLPEGLSPPPQPDLFVYGRPDDAARFLSESGLRVRFQEILPLAWELESPKDLFTIFLNGTVGARMTLMTLDDAGRKTAALGVENAVASTYSTDHGYRVPAPVAHIVAHPI